MEEHTLWPINATSTVEGIGVGESATRKGCAEDAQNVIECRPRPVYSASVLKWGPQAGVSSGVLTEGTECPNGESTPDSPQTQQPHLLQIYQMKRSGQGYKEGRNTVSRTRTGVVPYVNLKWKCPSLNATASFDRAIVMR